MAGLHAHPAVGRRAVLLGAVVGLAVGGARAQQPERVGAIEAECNLLVMDLKGKGLPEGDAELPSVLTEALVGELNEVSGCQIISEADIASMIQFEATKAQCGGELDSCLAEVGAAFGAERVVSGTVGRIGEEYLLTARLLDVQRGSVEGRAEQNVTGGKEGLRIAAKNLGRALFDKDALPAATPAASADGESPADGGMSLALLGGVGLATVGGLLAAGGGALTGLAELRMSDPGAADKNEMQLLGLFGLGGVGVGALVGVGGGVLIAVGAME